MSPRPHAGAAHRLRRDERDREGEVLQLMQSGRADVDEDAYLAVIHRKTAKLFEAAARLGAVLAETRRGRMRSPATAGTSAPRSRSWTTSSTTRATPRRSARIWR